MKQFETPEIDRYPLIIKDQITGKLDGFGDGSGDLLPEDDIQQN